VSVQASSWAWDQTIVESPAQQLVLLFIANNANIDGLGAFPGIKLIAAKTRLSERTVKRCIKELLALGATSRTDGSIAAAYIKRRDRRPNEYRLAMARGDTVTPRKPVDKLLRIARTGCQSRPNGVPIATERGASLSPDPEENRKRSEEEDAQIARARIRERIRKTAHTLTASGDV